MLEQCPLCGEVPQISYACGDYFVYCKEGCKSPMCDHASESTTITHWNEWVKEQI